MLSSSLEVESQRVDYNFDTTSPIKCDIEAFVFSKQ